MIIIFTFPTLVVEEEMIVMEYSYLSVKDFIVHAENVRNIKIVDVKLTNSNDSGYGEIYNDGQSVKIGDFGEEYIVTIEAVGINGWKIKEEVKLGSYQEPPTYSE